MGRKLRVDFSNETVSDEDNRDRDGAVCSFLPRIPFSSLSAIHQTNRHLQAGTSGGNYPNPGAANGSSGANAPSASIQATGPGGGGGSSLPPLPQGKDLPPGVSCTDAISRTLNTLPPAQLLDILQQMKTLATTDPARATELLAQAPQLSYAIFQALLIMGLVSPDAINSVLEPGAPHIPAPAAYGSSSGASGGAPMATGTPPIAAPGAGGYAPPPQQAAAIPPPIAAPVAQAPPPAGQDPEALMRAVMELPQETIDQLPEAERQQIMALRASYGAQNRR